MAQKRGEPGRRVLVVEDDRLVQEVIQGVLVHHGYAAVTAGDGPSALAAAQDGPPDAVVLDLQIPQLHGREVLAELKARFPGLPVVVYSARGDFAETLASLTEVDVCLPKSGDPTRLLEALDRELRRRRRNGP